MKNEIFCTKYTLYDKSQTVDVLTILISQIIFIFIFFNYCTVQEKKKKSRFGNHKTFFVSHVLIFLTSLSQSQN